MQGRLLQRAHIRIGPNCSVSCVALSADGQYLAVGTLPIAGGVLQEHLGPADRPCPVAGAMQGLRLYDRTGQCLLSYPGDGTELPVSLIAMTPDMHWLFLATREGELYGMEAAKWLSGTKPELRLLHRTPADLNSLSVSADGSLIALGHLSPALTVLQTDGHVVWRRHRDTGNATRGHIWSTALDAAGTSMSVGSAGAEHVTLAIMDPQTGALCAGHSMDAPVVHLAPPLNSAIVAAPFVGSYEYRLVGYSLDLRSELWRRTFEEPICALVAGPQNDRVFVCVGHEGRIMAWDEQGRETAEEIRLNVQIKCLAVAASNDLVAGTHDGYIYWLTYETGTTDL